MIQKECHIFYQNPIAYGIPMKLHSFDCFCHKLYISENIISRFKYFFLLFLHNMPSMLVHIMILFDISILEDDAAEDQL